MGKKYFHELSDEEYKVLLDSDMGIREFMDSYSQPLWCNYPNALEGRMGCWSLMGLWGIKNRIRCERDCVNCDCYESKK